MHRPLLGSLACAFSLCAAAGVPSSVGAQEPIAFDSLRAWITDSTIFEPFLASDWQPLRQVLRDGTVREDTPLLVLEVAGRTLALSVEQMSYHHAAQGEFAGEPWMVSF